MEEMYSCSFETQLGVIAVHATDHAVCAIEFVLGDVDLHADLGNDMTHEAQRQLEEYFKGQRQNFDLPVSLQGTVFQRAVWQQLNLIPYGTTRSYQQLAQAIKNPKAMRAVGSANGKNPLPIIVPCHRVIASDGKLAGYAFGEDKKAWLIDFEKENSHH